MSDVLISLVTIAVLTTITPGPSTVLAAVSGARFGFRRSVPLMTGVTVGLVSVMAATAYGLAALLQTVPTLHLMMKIIGSTYLLWLAWKIAGGGVPNDDSSAAFAPLGLGAGLVILWLNPKAWLMALSVAAAYAGLTDGPFRLAVLLGAVFGVAAASSLSLWCVGGRAMAGLARTAGRWRAINAALGLLTAVSVLLIWV